MAPPDARSVYKQCQRSYDEMLINVNVPVELSGSRIIGFPYYSLGTRSDANYQKQALKLKGSKDTSLN